MKINRFKALNLVMLFLIVLSLSAWSWGTDFDEGDLDMQKYSINGDRDDGLAFDPDSDGFNEIVFNADGSITIGDFSLPASDGDADQVMVTDGLGTITWEDQSGNGVDLTGFEDYAMIFPISESLTYSEGIFTDAAGNLSIAEALSVFGVIHAEGGVLMGSNLAMGGNNITGLDSLAATGSATLGSIVLGGITVADVLISTDGASTSDSVLVTAGYVDAHGGGLTNMIDTADGNNALKDLTVSGDTMLNGTLAVGSTGGGEISNSSGEIDIIGNLTLDGTLTSISGDWFYKGGELNTGGGSGTPAGADGALQYNNGGSFGGFGSYDDVAGDLSLPGNLTINGAGETIVFIDKGVDATISIDASVMLSLSTTGVVFVGGAEAGIDFNDTAIDATISTNGTISMSLSETGYLVTAEGDMLVNGDLTVVGTIYQGVEGAGAAGSVVTYDFLDDLEQAAKYQYQPEDLHSDFVIKPVEPLGKRAERVLKLYSGAFKAVKIRLDICFAWLVVLSFWNVLLTVLVIARRE